MELRSLITLLIWSLTLASLRAQSSGPVEYRRACDRIDADILNGDLTTALLRCDTLLANHAELKARHAFKALQLACAVQDPERSRSWLERCFLLGVPLGTVQQDHFTSPALADPAMSAICDRYEALRADHRSRTNPVIARTIDSLMAIDQRLTARVNEGFFVFRYTVHELAWRRNNARQFRIIKAITEQYGFPGERLIGPPTPADTSGTAPAAYALSDRRAFIMLIHYFSNARPDEQAFLQRELEAGRLPADQFGALQDFIARWGGRRSRDTPYYNVWHTDPVLEHRDAIEERRHRIGLPSLEHQDRVSRALRDRRASGTSDSSIVLQ